MASFDGHGINGNLVSSFVMGSMLDYIKNSTRFKSIDLKASSSDEIVKAMKKAFRYAQDKAKD